GNGHEAEEVCREAVRVGQQRQRPSRGGRPSATPRDLQGHRWVAGTSRAHDPTSRASWSLPPLPCSGCPAGASLLQRRSCPVLPLISLRTRTPRLTPPSEPHSQRSPAKES